MSKDTIRTQRPLSNARYASLRADAPHVASGAGDGTTPAPSIRPADVLTRGARGTGAELSSRDVRTLQRALRLIKAARVDAQGRDPEAVRAALERMAFLFGYINGFLDGKGLAAKSLNPGFQNVFQSSLVFVADPDAQLDQAIESFDEAIQPTPTRAIPLIVWGALLLIGGVGTKACGEALKASDK